MKTADYGKAITVNLGEVWRCTCGKEQKFGAWVAAHWSEELVHTCVCGIRRNLVYGRLRTPKRKEATDDTRTNRR